MVTLTRRTFDQSDQTVRPVEKITMDVVEIDGRRFTRVTAEPGWKWSVQNKPVLQTETCQVDHLLLVISGSFAALDADGLEVQYAAGDLGHIAPGHDGWTIGDAPAVWIEIPH